MLTIRTLLTGLAALAEIATAIDYPPECPAPTPVKVIDLQWFNGSSSLKCGRTFYNTRSAYCYNPKNPTLWEEPISRDDCMKNKNGTWRQVCYNDDMPQYPPPWGHGPADSLNYTYVGRTWAGNANCFRNGTGYLHHDDFGVGRTDCSGTHSWQQDFSYFYGSSHEESSMARWELTTGYGNGIKCTNGSIMTYTARADFPLKCTIDAQKNATCTAEPFDLTVIAYQIYTDPNSN